MQVQLIGTGNDVSFFSIIYKLEINAKSKGSINLLTKF